MRVLLTADTVGGVWTYALDLTRGLVAGGHAVTLALLGPADAGTRRAEARDAGATPVETGLPLDWLAERPEDVLAAGRRLAALAREVGAEIVHLNSPALAADASFPCPVVGFCHSCLATWWQALRGGPLPEDFRWRTDLLARGYARCDLLAAPSAAFASATQAAYALPSRPSVVHNGRVPVRRADRRTAARLEAHAAVPHDAARAVGPLGRSVETNAPHPEVAAQRPSKDAPRSYVLRGSTSGRAPQHEGGMGEQERGELWFGRAPTAVTAGRLWDEGKNLAALDRAAARTALPVLAAGPTEGPNGARVVLEHVEALGSLAPRDLAARLAARPIFVSLALYEPFGLAVLEAAQAGCPLVLSDIPTFRELWDGAAIFVDPHDDRAAAAALDALAADEGSRSRHGALAQARSTAYGVERMVERTLGLYAAALERSPAQLRAAS